MSQEYPNGGSIRTSTRKTSDKAADFFGSIDIDGEVLDYVLMCAENGKPVQIELGGWKKQGTNGPFVSLRGQIPYAERQGGSAPQRSAPRRQQQDNFLDEPRQETRRAPPPTQRNAYADRSERPQPATRSTRPNQNFRNDLDDDFPESLGGGRGPRSNAPDKSPWDD
jgi:hypothetical protein